VSQRTKSNKFQNPVALKKKNYQATKKEEKNQPKIFRGVIAQSTRQLIEVLDE
jgi:hypothetical protein